MQRKAWAWAPSSWRSCGRIGRLGLCGTRTVYDERSELALVDPNVDAILVVKASKVSNGIRGIEESS